METAQYNMIEGREVQSQPSLEAPYVTIIRDIVHEKIPQHKQSFDIALDEINRQVVGDGFSIFESKSEQFKGVKFLALHLSVAPDLIVKIAGQAADLPETSQETSDEEAKDPKIEQYAYFIQPATGRPPDGSGLSGLDMGIDRFIREMPRIVAAIKRGEKPPKVDIFMLGDPASLGGETTVNFNDAVSQTGFDAYGKLYAEYVERSVLDLAGQLDKTRIVLQGPSKGAITSDLTFQHLPAELKERTLMLYDNPAGTHGMNIPTEIGRSANLVLGSIYELIARLKFGTITLSDFSGQKQFYQDILKAKGIEVLDEQVRLKGELFKAELLKLAKGTPLNKEHKSYARISTPIL